MKRLLFVLPWLSLCSPAFSQQLLKQSSTAQALEFYMTDSSDHISAKTGLTCTVTLRKANPSAGGAFGSPIGTVREIGNGWYQVDGNANDTNTLGSLILHATASGADPADYKFIVVAFDPQSANNLGLAALPTANPGATNGLLIAGTNAPVTITGAGNALTLTSTSSGSGLSCTGNTAAPGIITTGGVSNGDGFKCVAGGGSGVPIRGNITGNITGNVTGSVASVAAGGIGSSSFAAGAIDATAIADGAIDRATFAVDTGMQTVRSNTLQDATDGTHATLDASASGTGNRYVGHYLYITSGSGSGMISQITAYNASTKVCTVAPGWRVQPGTGDTFAILSAPGETMNYMLDSFASDGVFSVAALANAPSGGGGGGGGGSDPWLTALPGSYTSGEAGYILAQLATDLANNTTTLQDVSDQTTDAATSAEAAAMSAADAANSSETVVSKLPDAGRIIAAAGDTAVNLDQVTGGGGGAATVDADILSPKRVWIGSDYRATNIVEVAKGFVGTLGLKPDINPATTINSVSSVTFSGPDTVTASNLEVDRSRMEAHFTVPALTTSGTYTVIIKVVTVDGQTIATTCTLKVH